MYFILIKYSEIRLLRFYISECSCRMLLGILPESDRGQVLYSVRWTFISFLYCVCGCDIADYAMYKTLTFNQLYGLYHVYFYYKKMIIKPNNFILEVGMQRNEIQNQCINFSIKLKKRMDDIIKRQRRY